MKKIISIVLTCILTVICLSACSTQTTNISNQKLTTLTEITSENVKNKAILIVDPTVDNSAVENMLADFSNKFNLNIVKVEYGKDWKDFEKSQEKETGTSSELSYNIENYLQTIEDEELLTKVYEHFNIALVQIVESGDYEIEEEMKKVEELLPEYTAKDYTEYVKEVSYMYTTMLPNGNVDSLNLPQLLVFGQQEISRLQGISLHPEKFAYVAMTNGIFDLEKDSSIDRMIEKIKNKETFIAIFSTSTCSYCLDTVPVFEKIAPTFNVPVVEINLASVHNDSDKVQELIDNNYINGEISGTPTIYYYKNGEIADSEHGLMTATQITNFLNRNK